VRGCMSLVSVYIIR